VTGAPSWVRLGASSVILWVGALFCTIGAPFFALGAHEALKELLFARNAQRVQATVVEKTLQIAQPGKNPTTRYLIRYRFAAADASQVERTESVPVEQWESVASGAAFEVRYLPGDPARSRAATDTDWPFALIFMALGAVFCAVGAPLAYFGGKETTRQWRLWRTGIAAPATVTGIAASSTTINGVRQLQILYRYKDSLGAAHEGRSAPMSPGAASEWSKGTSGFARYDERDPQSSIWTGSA
jgi:hypothetical protein